MNKSIEELFEEHFSVTCQRDAIPDCYTHMEFLEKVKEEVSELSEEFPECLENEDNYSSMKQEAVDVMMTVVNMFIYHNIDLKNELMININKNKERV